MIRRVRRQFILITMSLLTAVLLVPLVALNVITEAMSYQQSQSLLEQIAGSEAQMWRRTVPARPAARHDTCRQHRRDHRGNGHLRRDLHHHGDLRYCRKFHGGTKSAGGYPDSTAAAGGNAAANRTQCFT